MSAQIKKSIKDSSHRLKDKPPPMLPPCRVCGEKASGLHYGVNTCEACKAFFRRSLQRGSKYKCSEDNKCLISSGRRSSCSACRFNKCSKLGMCKEAIKTGRYTHEKRTEDIMEVKRLSQMKQQQQQLDQQQQQLDQQQQQHQQSSLQILTPQSASSLDYNSPILDHMEVDHNNNNNNHQHRQQQQHFFASPTYTKLEFNDDDDNNEISLFNDSNKIDTKNFVANIDTPRSNDSVYNNNNNNNKNNHNNNSNNNNHNNRQEVFVTEEKLNEIIQTITQTYLRETLFTKEFLMQLPQRQKEYLERKALQNEVFGPLKPLSKDEYNRIYQSTGIDLDGRKEYIQDELPHLENAVKKFISFVKTIPGFNELSIDDQIALIKASKFEAWMIFCHKLFNVEDKLYTKQSGQIVHIDDMKKVNNEEFVEAIFILESQLQRMNLSHEETCIMVAICVMYTDNCYLQNAKLVEESQTLLVECLFHIFKKDHPEEPLRFAHFISWVLQLRTLKEMHSKEEEVFVMEWSNKVEIPKLVYEIWST